MLSKVTPMRMQYMKIKLCYVDCILFFRLGDFYEMFDEDAILASKLLNLTLTSRERNVEDPEQRVPMCGLPYHSCQPYIRKLLEEGHKVAICEQVEEVSEAKGLVNREVIRVITPGTITESTMLNSETSNYVASVYLKGDSGACAFCDVSTGEFCVASFPENAPTHLLNELVRFSPKEAILSDEASENEEIFGLLRVKLETMVEYASSAFVEENPKAVLCKQFNEKKVDSIVVDGDRLGTMTAAALLKYIEATQKVDLSHMKDIDVLTKGRFMELDYTSRRNLELTESFKTREKKGSLLGVLDKTKTPMGSRLMRSWVERPLLSLTAIHRRHEAVETLCDDNELRQEIIELMKGIGDINRICGKAVCNTTNARELFSLGIYCNDVPGFYYKLRDSKCIGLRKMVDYPFIGKISLKLVHAFEENAPNNPRDGGIIKKGYSSKLDELRKLRDESAKTLAEFEVREREKTGIKKLKIGYNRVFGYYIEVPKMYAKSVPEEYIRKQTISTSERFYTHELKEMETAILSAKDTINDMEFRFYEDLRLEIVSLAEEFKIISDKVAELDCICALADVAARNRFVRPIVDNSDIIDIKGGRHCIVEQMQKDVLFVENDVYLDRKDNNIAIITGPNMAGKSTYMRQCALICLMAQMGSFVPAKFAKIGLIDRVFTRIGASDDLSSGLSTFMVEMTEVATILKFATNKSLLILDEIGRGTSTFDGMAIAKSVLEYCANKEKLGAKTLFATHYHELASLEAQFEGICNYNIKAKKQGNDLIFLRKVVRGFADDSYGIEVAKLAGLPMEIITRANQCLRELESGKKISQLPKVAMNIQEETKEFEIKRAEEERKLYELDMKNAEIVKSIDEISLDSLSPIQAMNFLYQLKEKVRD